MLSAKELMLSNCGTREDSWKSLALQWDQTSSILKKINLEYSLERLMSKGKVPILWPSHAKSRLIGKDPEAGKDWGQEEKGLTEDETVRQHCQLKGHEFEQTLGDSEGQGRLESCSSLGHKESDMIQWLNNNNTGGISSDKEGISHQSQLQCMKCLACVCVCVLHFREPVGYIWVFLGSFSVFHHTKIWVCGVFN